MKFLIASCRDFHGPPGLSFCHPLPCVHPHTHWTLGRFRNTQGNLQSHGLCTRRSQRLQHPFPHSAPGWHRLTSQALGPCCFFRAGSGTSLLKAVPPPFSITECSALPLWVPLSQLTNLLCVCWLPPCSSQPPSECEFREGRNYFLALGYIPST